MFKNKRNDRSKVNDVNVINKGKENTKKKKKTLTKKELKLMVFLTRFSNQKIPKTISIK